MKAKTDFFSQTSTLNSENRHTDQSDENRNVKCRRKCGWEVQQKKKRNVDERVWT